MNGHRPGKESEVRKIVATEYLSLDGVFQEPGEWSRPFWSDQAAKFKLDELFASDVLLLGRTTYQGFASAWPKMERDSAGFADRMNGMPKYVASRTLKKLDWNNSRLIEGDLADAVGRLKQETGKDVLIGGSGDVVNQLLRQDLIDELRIMLYPIVLGGGKRLFRDGMKKSLRLAKTNELGNGVVVLSYEPAR